MKHLLLITIAAVVLVGCGPSISIHKAAKEGNIEVVKQHLAAGADVNVKNNAGWVPLHMATALDHKEITELLIAESADVNANNKTRMTPVFDAAFSGHKEFVELLIAKGANVNEKDNRTSTPLHEAAVLGHKEFVALLLANGANINVKRRSGGTPTPLDNVEGAIKHYSHRSNYSPKKIAALKETAEFLRKNGGKTSDGLKADESI